MRCPWQTVEDTYKYRDMSRPEGYGIKKVTVFGDCITIYCPFYNSEERRCDRVDVSTGRLQYEDDAEESYWIRQSFSDGGFNYLCNSCHATRVEGGNYCPNCGKKMSTEIRHKDVDGESPYSTDPDFDVFDKT